MKLTLRELRCDELEQAAGLLARSMRDNPIDVAAFAITEDSRRERALVRFYRPVLRGLFRRGTIVGAFDGETMTGVCAIAPPAHCQPTALEKIEVFPSMVFGNKLGTPLRIMSWVGEWARRDPTEPHWHLGPVGVEPDLQGQGIGSAMVADFCARIGEAGAYLETDKDQNVGFYRKFGFDVRAECKVLGVPNWFMSRDGELKR
jgi:ribosomal protein S18 acetylase RimI-like enzyme